MKGSYCIALKCRKDFTAVIGKLGEIKFKKGFYVYVGSALNSIEKRVERHKRKEKPLFWHIDYITAEKEIEFAKAFFRESPEKEECRMAKIVSEKGIPVKGFGCSDCKCDSHLFSVDEISFLEGFMEALE